MIKGIASGKASFLLSIIGISNIFGRIGLSALSDHPRINRMYLYITCHIICGMSEYKSDKFSSGNWIIILYRPHDEQLLLQLFDPHSILHCIWHHFGSWNWNEISSSH